LIIAVLKVVFVRYLLCSLLLGKAVIKQEADSYPEMPKIKQEPEVESQPSAVSPTSKRKSPAESEVNGGNDSPGKKKPKLEKFIVAPAHAQHVAEFPPRLEVSCVAAANDMWRQTPPAAQTCTKQEKKKKKNKQYKDRHRSGNDADEEEVEDACRRRQKESRGHHHHAKKAKKKARQDEAAAAMVYKVEKEEEDEEEEEEKEEKESRQKKKERRKKKRKEKRKQQQRVRVTGLEEDRVMEIMDRTPTPSRGALLIKQEVLQATQSDTEDERGQSFR
jgi:hypothetical protein